MIVIELEGSKVTVSEAPLEVARQLDELLSYPVEGAWFSKAYRMKRWDGKVHFIRVKRRSGGYTFPIGLLPDVKTALSNMGVVFRVQDRRGPGEPLPEHLYDPGKRLRPYQDQAVESIEVGRADVKQLGILKMPIRSGKTLTASLLIHKLNLRTLFVVPSIMLLEQAATVFRSVFSGLAVGEIGDGERTAGDITVATFQSLMSGSGSKDVREVLNRAGLLIVDECHHLEAEEWRRPLMECPAAARVGLSATAYISRRKPNERAALWLKAICGPVVYEVDMAYLVRKGWLVPTEVRLYTIKSPSDDSDWSSGIYDRLITHNRPRNHRIVQCAVEASAEGLRTLVDIGRIQHGENLLEMLRSEGLRAELLINKSTSEERTETVARLRAGRLDVIVSTLLGEGVDIPELEVVINAEGGAARKSTIQRLRNMTPSEGKTGATIIDFVDLTNPYLAEHSLERIKAYKAEQCFSIKACGT